MTIEDLDITGSAYNKLVRMGITTMDQLYELSKDDVRAMRLRRGDRYCLMHELEKHMHDAEVEKLMDIYDEQIELLNNKAVYWLNEYAKLAKAIRAIPVEEDVLCG